MFQLLFHGQVVLFAVLLVAIVFSLTLHEFGHALAGTALGDDTAKRSGRLSLNPFDHIDPMGLLMVVFVGFGYARPVPFNPRRVPHGWGSAVVAAAGPAMNLLLAVVAVNLLVLARQSTSFDISPLGMQFLMISAQINLLLMLFNLMPIGPLDGHYIMSWLLPRDMSLRFDDFNMRHGSQLLMVLILLSIVGLPVFRFLTSFADQILPYLVFV